MINIICIVISVIGFGALCASWVLFYKIYKNKSYFNQEYGNKLIELENLNFELQKKQDELTEVRRITDQTIQSVLATEQKKLDERLAELVNTHPINDYNEQLEVLGRQIADRHTVLRVLQERHIGELQKQDEDEKCFLRLAPNDIEDIKTLRELQSKIHRSDAFNKLIWTEYYQKPLQDLRKRLGADGVTGIYMIKDSDGVVYIGQSANIGIRWTEHVKGGLGIGTSVYALNRFYKALYSSGIENFSFSILEECPRERLNERETYWIKFFNATEYGCGYNTKSGNGG